jgi:hypothetical protein
VEVPRSKLETRRERSWTEFVRLGSTRGAGGVRVLLPRPVRRSRLLAEFTREVVAPRVAEERSSPELEPRVWPVAPRVEVPAEDPIEGRW